VKFNSWLKLTNFLLTGEGVREFPQFASFHATSQVLEINKYEKHFKVSHNKESHQVEGLARIYFCITGKSGEVGKKKETFSAPHAGNRSKDLVNHS
jgi:hypothetical protein